MLKPNENEAYFFLREHPTKMGHKGRPIGVLALRVEFTRPESIARGVPATPFVCLSASMCCPTDEWSRTRGVDMALGRLRARRTRANEWESRVTRLRRPAGHPMPPSEVACALRLLGMPDGRVDWADASVTLDAVTRGMLRRAGWLPNEDQGAAE